MSHESESNLILEPPSDARVKETENTLRSPLYSIGIDATPNLREKIAEVHGNGSEVVKAVSELDRYVSDPSIRKSAWFWNFYKRVKSGISRMYPYADNSTCRRMTQEFIEELFNGGYIRVLQSLSGKSGANTVSFARDYADYYSVSIGAALLFGPHGGANRELLHFIATEKVRGQHRYGIKPDAQWSEKAKIRWYQAQRQISWPTIMNRDGERIPLEVADQQGQLPAGVTDTLRELWRRTPALRYYTGTNRLSGDIPYQIIEDVVDVMLQGRFSTLNEPEKTRYNQIVEQANQQGLDPFYVVYRNFFRNKKVLQLLWNRARQWLYDYSLSLWQAQNELWLAEGKREPANGIVYKPAQSIRKDTAPKKKTPGTIYLNNGRYYWVVANKMKPRPLIDPRTKPKVPGSFLVERGRYYWYVPRWIKRQRLVPRGQKFSTTDPATAKRIARQLWNQIKRDDPALATTILEKTRSQGLATKDRVRAEQIAAQLWHQIQKQDPKLAARIKQDNRPQAKDHWVAQIVVGGKHRHIGTYHTQAEAEAAYRQEFEKTFGYPPGYNVQCIPKLDKVWPTWTEEKARLALLNGCPRMPVIGQSAQTEPLQLIVERIQSIDWLVKHCMLVFDKNSPVALPDIAIQSCGEQWYAEIKQQGKRPVIQGSAVIDKEHRRFRITIYGQGLETSRVLIEEVYHIVYEVIRHARPHLFQAIRKWHSQQLKQGLDPTWPLHEVFADLMVREEESPESTDLPRRVIDYAQKAFSANHTVPGHLIKKIVSA